MPSDLVLRLLPQGAIPQVQIGPVPLRQAMPGQPPDLILRDSPGQPPDQILAGQTGQPADDQTWAKTDQFHPLQIGHPLGRCLQG